MFSARQLNKVETDGGGVMEYLQRFFKVPEESFFLFGPRGTGKSTWLKRHFSDALYIDLLATDILREFIAWPERLLPAVAAHPDKKLVIIDEIQKAPELLSIVHKLIEGDKSLRFILTGSSARKLKRTGVDLLAGRAVKKTLHPFMAAEMGNTFDLNSALRYGTVPIVTASGNPGRILKTYIDIYLNEEVKQEGMVRTIGDFTRFLSAAALSHGQLLTVSNVAQDCQVKRKTVEGYFTILEDLLIGSTIPVFSRRAQRAVVSHPKFYFFDTGVFHSLRPRGPVDTPEEITGAALEGLVLQHLRAWIDYSEIDASIFFWRNRSGSEVDFILYGENLFPAINVKASHRVKSEHLRGLDSFRRDYPQCEPLLLYMGTRRLSINGIRCIPCDDFLRALVPGSEFPFTGA